MPLPAEEQDCVETFGSVRKRLADAQDRLLKELDITAGELHVIARRGDLRETDSAMEWFSAYAAYRDWINETGLGDPPDPPMDHLRRRWERKLVEVASLKARLRILEPNGPEDVLRASGECTCLSCGLEYREHAEHPFAPTYMILCDGRVVKT